MQQINKGTLTAAQNNKLRVVLLVSGPHQHNSGEGCNLVDEFDVSRTHLHVVYALQRFSF